MSETRFDWVCKPGYQLNDLFWLGIDVEIDFQMVAPKICGEGREGNTAALPLVDLDEIKLARIAKSNRVRSLSCTTARLGSIRTEPACWDA